MKTSNPNQKTSLGVQVPSKEVLSSRLRGWLSLAHWQLGNFFWLLLGAALLIPVLLSLRTSFERSIIASKQQVQAIQASQQLQLQRRAKDANQRTEPLQDIRSASVKLDLPKDTAGNIAPLERYLREQLTKGLEIRQIDYQWPATTSSANKTARPSNLIRKVDVSIQMRGDYPAIRAWLGTVLLEAPHIQLTSLQMQRQGKDQSIVACSISLSVFYQVLA
jgi:cytoskeletal protein RodZ